MVVKICALSKKTNKGQPSNFVVIQIQAWVIIPFVHKYTGTSKISQFLPRTI